MANLIEPRTLRGFRDYPPDLMLPREQLLERARRVYRSYGFAPIDTPALEYAEILLGKGGEESDRLIYRFRDHGDRDVALRFDLTVPFARFSAQYISKLGTPFKRYAMGPVWRGENNAHGRYREFWQCDFDTIGTTSNASDIETALVIHDLMLALGFERFEVRINNRQVLNGLLEQVGLTGRTAACLRALDKLDKIGAEAVQAEMVEQAGAAPEQAERVLTLAGMRGTNSEILSQLERDFAGNERTRQGIGCLRQLIDVTRALELPEERIRIDLSIARGLDYYTGTIYETFLLDLLKIGSVCSGGRYDNLAGLYTKQHLPGVGASLGLDRLLAAMEELKLLPKVATPAPVLVLQFDAQWLADYQRLARALRLADIGVEVYPEAKKPGVQLKYAESRGFAIALIAGSDEWSQGVCKIKQLARREETTVRIQEVPMAVRRLLAESTAWS
jgi:histidyl-tRNA synthetase